MNTLSPSKFYDQPVVPEQTVDLDSMPVYRAQQFPAVGPVPWLDRPDALDEIERRQADGSITAEEAELCRKWSLDGYVVMPGFYDHELLDTVWAAYEAAIADGTLKPPVEPMFAGDELPGRVANPHFSVPAVYLMLHEARMSRLVSLLMGVKAAPFQTIMGHKSSQQLEHSDSIHMSTYPTGYLAANWIAFEDIHPDSGPLVYYRGSHKLPYVLSENLGIEVEQGYNGYHASYEPAIQNLIATHKFTRKLFIPKKGDVLLWHANLLHGGTRLNGPDHASRRALVCHFFAEGVVCYHDLTGTLSHTQLGRDVFSFDRKALYAAQEQTHSDPVAAGQPGEAESQAMHLLHRAQTVLRNEGAAALLGKTLGYLKRSAH